MTVYTVAYLIALLVAGAGILVTPHTARLAAISALIIAGTLLVQSLGGK